MLPSGRRPRRIGRGGCAWRLGWSVGGRMQLAELSLHPEQIALQDGQRLADAEPDNLRDPQAADRGDTVNVGTQFVAEANVHVHVYVAISWCLLGHSVLLCYKVIMMVCDARRLGLRQCDDAVTMRLPSDPKMKNFSIRFPLDQKLAVRRVSKRFGLSEADVVRMCVSANLPRIIRRLRAKSIKALAA